MEDYRTALLSRYALLENRYSPTGINVGTYNTPVNFKESLTVPVHRWYGYKEGFSPSFVKSFFDEFAPCPNPIVFDPFGGVGTTCLEAMKAGFSSVYMDVSPLGVFAATVKTTIYSSEDICSIKATIDNLDVSLVQSSPTAVNNDTVKRYFAAETWESILKLREYIFSRGNVRVRNILLLALLSLLEEVSTHRKNGNGVKRKILPPQPTTLKHLLFLLKDRVSMFVADIHDTKLLGSCKIIHASNLEGYRLEQKADLVLTSPPYANCFDYSKVYLTELWVGGFFQTKIDQQTFRESSVASHVHYHWKRSWQRQGSALVDSLIAPYLKDKKLWNPHIPDMLIRYFDDMGVFLQNLSTNLNINAVVGIVVGNSVYGGIPIATDLLIAEMAEHIGFQCIKIQVYRRVVASSQQMVQLSEDEKHYVRESMVVLKWTKK